MRYYTDTRLIDHHMHIFKPICFQQVHWPSIVSRTCCHLRQVMWIALWHPRRRQETTADDAFARIPAAFSCNLETCQPLMEIALLLASQMSFSQRRRCRSCKVQMGQPSASRGEPATKVETEAHITGHSCFV